MEQQLFAYFQSSPSLSVMAIEAEIKCPKHTLRLWLKGHRKLPEKWQRPLAEVLEKYGFNNNNNNKTMSIYDKGRAVQFENEVAPSTALRAYAEMLEERLSTHTEIALEFVCETPKSHFEPENGLIILDEGTYKLCIVNENFRTKDQNANFYFFDLKAFINYDLNQ